MYRTFLTVPLVLAVLVVLGAWSAVTRMGTASAQPTCSVATLTGPYAISSSGVGLSGPFAVVGVWTFNGQGSLTESSTESNNGSIARRSITGTYTLGPDCTGSMTFNFPGGQAHADLVVSDGGRELRALQTDSGTVVLITGQRQ